MPNALYTSAPDTLYWRAGDRAGEAQFIAAHDFRHRTYKSAASRLGRAISPCFLTGKIDADWFGRHLLCHLAHAQIFPGLGSQLSVALETPPADDEGALYDWMRRHALIHAQLDIAYGVK